MFKSVKKYIVYITKLKFMPTFESAVNYVKSKFVFL